VSPDVNLFLTTCRDRINPLLDNCLPITGEPTTLLSAARYATLGNGKRIRPCLVYAGALAVGEISQATDRVACAIELMHTYSLIHDDLPSMDDDALRRGKPTCHVVYGEATAILAGDGLQALAFEQLSEPGRFDPGLALSFVNQLARASGLSGMVLGQAMDMDATDKQVDLPYLETMHRRKTADLITASVMMGAQSSSSGAQPNSLLALSDYGRAIGLAFQVMDDILDARSNTAVLGKPAGADAKLHKSTYTSLLGLDRAADMRDKLFRQSLGALTEFDGRADHLRALAHHIINRDF
tara:strand:+ start:14086 stop:14976 length:891 start_codon:yes stop_codon:yes gene_type:complete